MADQPNQPNIQELMAKAKEMQEKMQIAQNELSQMEIIGESGGGLVKVTMTGRHDARKVEIADELMQGRKEILADLVAAAINDAARKVEKASQGKIMDLTKNMGLPETQGDETQ